MSHHNKHRPVDILTRALPAPNPAWTGIKARVSNGPSVLHAPAPLSHSAASRAKGELFGRITANALLRLLAPSLTSPHMGGGGGGGGGGESILGSSLTSREQPHFGGGVEGEGEGGEDPSKDVIVLDIRPLEAEAAFASVRIAGAIHTPFSMYMTQDRLPPAMHAARRQVPQPVVVLYDDSTGRPMDGPEFATKLIQAGKYDAVLVLEGGLRKVAVQAPQLLEGPRVEDYIAGVATELKRGEGGHGEELKRRRGPFSPSGSGGSGGGGGGIGGGGGDGSGGGGARSQSGTVSGRTVGSFGTARRF